MFREGLWEEGTRLQEGRSQPGFGGGVLLEEPQAKGTDVGKGLLYLNNRKEWPLWPEELM